MPWSSLPLRLDVDRHHRRDDLVDELRDGDVAAEHGRPGAASLSWTVTLDSSRCPMWSAMAVTPAPTAAADEGGDDGHREPAPGTAPVASAPACRAVDPGRASRRDRSWAGPRSGGFAGARLAGGPGAGGRPGRVRRRRRHGAAAVGATAGSEAHAAGSVGGSRPVPGRSSARSGSCLAPGSGGCSVSSLMSIPPDGTRALSHHCGGEEPARRIAYSGGRRGHVTGCRPGPNSGHGRGRGSVSAACHAGSTSS